jgi:hypothetical protein
MGRLHGLLDMLWSGFSFTRKECLKNEAALMDHLLEGHKVCVVLKISHVPNSVVVIVARSGRAAAASRPALLTSRACSVAALARTRRPSPRGRAAPLYGCFSRSHTDNLEACGATLSCPTKVLSKKPTQRRRPR